MQSKENMTDLVTRLLALADDISICNLQPFIRDALREAADELEQAQAFARKQVEAWGAVSQTFRDHIETAEQERDALKDTLADSDERWQVALDRMQAMVERAEKAEAKLASAEAEVRIIKPDRQAWYETALRFSNEIIEARAEAAALREALAEVAAVTESVPKSRHWVVLAQVYTRSKCALSQPGPGAAYQEHMRKLEAVVEAARNHKHPCQYLVDDAAECDLCQRLAALE